MILGNLFNKIREAFSTQSASVQKEEATPQAAHLASPVVQPPLSGHGIFQPSQFLRCPMPPLNVGVDSLRQFYRDGQVPQYRTVPPNSF